VAHPLFGPLCLPGLWSLPIVSFSLPLLGAFKKNKVWQGFIIYGISAINIFQFPSLVVWTLNITW
jgi:hypothetical protein